MSTPSIFKALGFARRELLADHAPYLAAATGAGRDTFCRALFQATGHALQSGHGLELIENGDIFPALERAIAAAKQSVHVLVYMWRPSPESRRLVEALAARSRSGVRCRVLVDPVGSEQVFGSNDFRGEVDRALRAAGCEVRFFRPLERRLMRRVVGRNHQKVVVVDGKVGFTGGFGIWHAWSGEGRSRDSWRDTHVRIEGPSVRELQLAFSWAWIEAGAELLGPEEFPDPREAGPVQATFVASSGTTGISDAERMTFFVITAAERRLWIANAYFSPTMPLILRLGEKARAGVDVRIMVPGKVNDIPVMKAAQRWTYQHLLPAGVRVFEYQPSMLHEKLMIVDEWLSVVGSTNLDVISMNRLVEGSLVVADGPFNAALARSYEADLTRTAEVRGRARLRSRPWRALCRENHRPGRTDLSRRSVVLREGLVFRAGLSPATGPRLNAQRGPARPARRSWRPPSSGLPAPPARWSSARR